MNSDPAAIHPGCRPHMKKPFGVGLTLMLLGTPGVQAQEVLRWEDFEICDRCELQLTEIVRLGNLDGEGIVESDFERVTWGEDFGYFMFHLGTSTVKQFDHGGRFVRLIGRRGEGPGEFSESVIDVKGIDGQIVVTDSRKNAFVVFDSAGGFVEDRRYAFESGPMVPVGDGRGVVVSMDRRPDLAGYPLHLVDLATGVALLHFGSRRANEWSMADGLRIAGSAVSRRGTVWWGSENGARVEEWSVDNELLRIVDGDLPWLPAVVPDAVPNGPPTPSLKSLALDSNDHLWIVNWVADPEWRDVRRVGPGAVLQADAHDFYDARLDIFDLGEKRHVGSYSWDALSPKLLNHGGEPAVSVMEYDDEMLPQVVVYRVGWDRVDSGDQLTAGGLSAQPAPRDNAHNCTYSTPNSSSADPRT